MGVELCRIKHKKTGRRCTPPLDLGLPRARKEEAMPAWTRAYWLPWLSICIW